MLRTQRDWGVAEGDGPAFFDPGIYGPKPSKAFRGLSPRKRGHAHGTAGAPDSYQVSETMEKTAKDAIFIALPAGAPGQGG
jgi:hypothetical protein